MRLLKGYIAHWVSGDGDVILSKNNKIYKYNLINQQIVQLFKLNYSNRVCNIFYKGLLRRLVRGGVHKIVKIDDRLIIFFDKRIITVENNSIVSTYKIKTCKRPLNVCLNKKNNEIYWGDYIARSDRYAINIYCSKDLGKTWDIVYTFPVGEIRHIHNIIYDQYRNNYLILTGDENKESGIWSTKDFKNLEPLLIGQQKYRATSLIVKNDYFILPTDTEVEQNYIQKYKISDNSLFQIDEIPSSSIGAQSISDYSFVSTMVEPSNVNLTGNSNLFVSADDVNWYNIFSIEKDLFSGKYFQYASIQIPDYANDYNGNYLYFNIVNTKGGSGVLVLSKDDIMEALDK